MDLHGHISQASNLQLHRQLLFGPVHNASPCLARVEGLGLRAYVDGP